MQSWYNKVICIVSGLPRLGVDIKYAVDVIQNALYVVIWSYC
jgi:hypothetical protein